MEPAARAVNFLSHELGEDEKENAGEIHRQRAPPNPPVINQTRQHEGEKPHDYPVSLLPPEIGSHRIFAHIGRAVDGDDAEYSERQHNNQEQPVEAEQLSEKRGHVDLVWPWAPRLLSSIRRPRNSQRVLPLKLGEDRPKMFLGSERPGQDKRLIVNGLQ